MSYFVDPNTRQVYYQTPAQAQQTVTDSGAAETATEPKAYVLPVQQAPAAPVVAPTSFFGLDMGSATFWIP